MKRILMPLPLLIVVLALVGVVTYMVIQRPAQGVQNEPAGMRASRNGQFHLVASRTWAGRKPLILSLADTGSVIRRAGRQFQSLEEATRAAGYSPRMPSATALSPIAVFVLGGSDPAIEVDYAASTTLTIDPQGSPPAFAPPTLTAVTGTSSNMVAKTPRFVDGRTVPFGTVLINGHKAVAAQGGTQILDLPGGGSGYLDTPSVVAWWDGCRYEIRSQEASVGNLVQMANLMYR